MAEEGMKALVVYYSLSGRRRLVAPSISEALNAAPPPLDC
jgi:hypothetical protein